MAERHAVNDCGRRAARALENHHFDPWSEAYRHDRTLGSRRSDERRRLHHLRDPRAGAQTLTQQPRHHRQPIQP